MDFGLGETVDMLRDNVQSFAADEIAPRAAAIDRDNEFPADLWQKLGDLGALSIAVAGEYSGADMGYLALTIAMEEVNRPSAPVGLSYGAHTSLCMNQIVRYGSDAQKQRYLPGLVSSEAVGALAMSETPRRIAAARASKEGQEGISAILERRELHWRTD